MGGWVVLGTAAGREVFGTAAEHDRARRSHATGGVYCNWRLFDTGLRVNYLNDGDPTKSRSEARDGGTSPEGPTGYHETHTSDQEANS